MPKQTCTCGGNLSEVDNTIGGLERYRLQCASCRAIFNLTQDYEGYLVPCVDCEHFVFCGPKIREYCAHCGFSVQELKEKHTPSAEDPWKCVCGAKFTTWGGRCLRPGKVCRIVQLYVNYRDLLDMHQRTDLKIPRKKI